MADINKITYVSLDKLGYYDEKLKAYVQGKDDALQANIDAEATRAKAAEATNALAAENAQKDVDALEGYVGTFTSETAKTVVEYIDAKTANVASDETVSALTDRVAKNETDISSLSANKADKTQVATDIADAVKAEEDARKGAISSLQEELNTLSGTVSSNKTSIENAVGELNATVEANEADIEGKMTALTERVAANETAVGTTLPNAIAGEKAAREAADTALDERLVEVETFFKTAEGETLDEALDTLVELQTYLNGEGAVADQMLLDIAANKKSIEDHVATDHDFGAADTALKAELTAEINKKADATTVEAMDTAYKAADDAIKGRLDSLEAIDHDAYKGADTALRTDLEAQIALKADKSAFDEEVQARKDADDALKTEVKGYAKDYADGLNGAMDSRMSAVEAASATHALASDLTALDGRVTTVEGKVGTLETEMDAVEALAAANKAAHEANAAAIALKASQAALTEEINRAKAAEQNLQDQLNAFEECTTNDIDGLFA